MTWKLLPTDYTDAVWSGLKRYTQVDNSDGTVSFNDVTTYTNKEKSFFGAKDANRMNEALNHIMSMLENDIYATKSELDKKLDATKVVNSNTVTEEGYALDARQANPNVSGSLAFKVNDTYTKAETDKKLADKADSSDIANADTNSAKFIRDSKDNHNISLSYIADELNTTLWMPAFKDRNTIGTISPTRLRSVMDAAPSSHTHDDRYYTEGEVNTKLDSKLNLTTYGKDDTSVYSGQIFANGSLVDDYAYFTINVSWIALQFSFANRGLYYRTKYSNNGWGEWEKCTTTFSGTGEPSSNLGNNGDIYVKY